MHEITAAAIASARAFALEMKSEIIHQLFCEECGDRELAASTLAVLGWTAREFILEALPEGGDA
jgi:hypothetical protein